MRSRLPPPRVSSRSWLVDWNEVKAGLTFPFLAISPAWAEQHCVVPDGFDKGKRFDLVPWQFWGLANFYRVKPAATVGQLAAAFHYRRGQIVLPQKAGKAPYTSAHVCVEGVGPALFGGWAVGGETWDCRDHGCGCGWIYEYQPGEPMAISWPTPLVQITAFSEDQTDNIYKALRPMIDDGPLSDLIPKTGEEFIRLPNKGEIAIVTSNAQSRLGQRVTFVPQDETGIWTETNKMIKVAETQRRGLAGMGGRAEETTNAWDPSEDSVAQRTSESRREDIFRLHPEAPAGLKYSNKAERRKIHRAVYFGCHWIDLDVIEAEAAELMETDEPQAERFFGNRAVAGEGKAFNSEVWKTLGKPEYRPAPGALITVGVDGALFQDSLACIATEIATGFQFVLEIQERPEKAPKDYEHDLEVVDQVMTAAVEQDFDVWRIYIDPGSQTGNIEPLVEKWLGRWGDERVHKWYMHRPRETGVAVHNYAVAIAKGVLSHDDNPVFAKHVKNAVRQKVNVKDENNPKLQLYRISKENPDSPNKIDAAAAGLLSWEARGDAIAADAQHQPSADLEETPQREEPTRPVIHKGDLTLRGDKYIDREDRNHLRPTRSSGPRRGR